MARKHSTGPRLEVVGLSKPTARSRVTNGVDILADVDGRSLWARRFRDLIILHTSDLGGLDQISEGEKALIRRCACLNVELERLETQFADVGQADLPSLETYQRASNSLRRLLQALGLQRRAKEIGPSLGELIRQDHERQRLAAESTP